MTSKLVYFITKILFKSPFASCLFLDSCEEAIVLRRVLQKGEWAHRQLPTREAEQMRKSLELVFRANDSMINLDMGIM